MAEVKWRPEGWDTNGDKAGWRKWESRAFEDAADTMLTMLRKTGWHVPKDFYPARGDGTWVFIPDE